MTLSAVNFVALLPCLCVIFAGLIAGVAVLSVLLARANKIEKLKSDGTEKAKPEFDEKTENADKADDLNISSTDTAETVNDDDGDGCAIESIENAEKGEEVC